MTWIRTVPVADATGRLKKIYDTAVSRVGRVFGILRTMSLDPAVLESSMIFYQRIMYAAVGLSRSQRQMLATVVSRANGCHY